MKFFHLSDLHLGKWVNGFSMLEEQRYWIDQLLALARQEHPDAIIMAGDIYDRRIPPAEAVTLLDYFLTALAELDIPVLIISGNHDSPERLDFGKDLMKQRGIYLAGKYDGTIPRVTLQDEHGQVDFFLLPYIRPAAVRPFFEEEPGSYEGAVRLALSRVQRRENVRSVLAAHQFVTFRGDEPERCDSEELSLGGMDQVDASVFEGFSYVALGHIHGPQRIGGAHIRYGGSPLCYSFSECRRQKYVTQVELDSTGNVEITQHTILPLHPMREIRGPLEQLLSDQIAAEGKEDYLHITLTDEQPIMDAIGKVRAVYPNVMKLDFAARLERDVEEQAQQVQEEMTPEQLLRQLYQMQHGQDVPEVQMKLFLQVLAEKEGQA